MDVSPALQCLQRTIEEFGRDDDSSTASPARGDFNRFTLGNQQ
jgi:hypothetical protein